jgi:two-component system phosphate regulon response regulator PhoB
MRILLVEDEDDSRQTLRKLIELRGHQVTAVVSAEEAERALAEESFPFLILDWMLPGKSGLELCRELRQRTDGDEMFVLAKVIAKISSKPWPPERTIISRNRSIFRD